MCAGVSFVPVFVSVNGGFALFLRLLGFGLVDKHVGPQISRRRKGLWTTGTFKRAFHLFALGRGLLCRRRGGPAGQLARRVPLVQPVLATVRLHVLCKSKFLPALQAAERLLTRVQVLVLMEEAAVLESLPADVAEVRARAGRVPAPVILHHRVVFEDHPALRTFVRFQGGVAALVVAQRHAVREGLAAFLAFENALLGMADHVLGDGHLELEVLAAQGAVVRLFCCAAAAVVPQGIHRVEETRTFCTFEGALLRWRLLLWGEQQLHLLFMLISVFDQAAPVLKGKATFFACKRGELVLVCVKVAVEVERLAAVERHPAILAQQAAFFRFRHRVAVLTDSHLLLLDPGDITRPL